MFDTIPQLRVTDPFLLLLSLLLSFFFFFSFFLFIYLFASLTVSQLPPRLPARLLAASFPLFLPLFASPPIILPHPLFPLPSLCCLLLHPVSPLHARTAAVSPLLFALTPTLPASLSSPGLPSFDFSPSLRTALPQPYRPRPFPRCLCPLPG